MSGKDYCEHGKWWQDDCAECMREVWAETAGNLANENATLQDRVLRLEREVTALKARLNFRIIGGH